MDTVEGVTIDGDDNDNEDVADEDGLDFLRLIDVKVVAEVDVVVNGSDDVELQSNLGLFGVKGEVDFKSPAIKPFSQISSPESFATREIISLNVILLKFITGSSLSLFCSAFLFLLKFFIVLRYSSREEVISQYALRGPVLLIESS